MIFKLSFKIENRSYRLIQITHLFSKLNGKIIDFRAKQIDATNLLSIHVSIQGDKKMYDQFVHKLNNTVSVMEINVAEKEKAMAY